MEERIRVCRCASELTSVIDDLVKMRGTIMLKDWATAESDYDLLKRHFESLQKCLDMKLPETEEWVNKLKDEGVDKRDVIRGDTCIAAITGRIIHEICKRGKGIEHL